MCIRDRVNQALAADRSTGKNFVSSSFRVVSPISPRLRQNDSENLSVQFSRRSPASSFVTWLWSPDIRTPALCSDERLTAHALRVRRSLGGRQGYTQNKSVRTKRPTQSRRPARTCGAAYQNRTDDLLITRGWRTGESPSFRAYPCLRLPIVACWGHAGGTCCKHCR